MNFIVYTSFIILILIFILQISILCSKTISRKYVGKRKSKVYSEEISELGKEVMNAVKDGKVKKQLLSNDAPIYNSNCALEQYESFVEQSTIYKIVVSLKENRFHG